jgi:hypothetical protein
MACGAASRPRPPDTAGGRDAELAQAARRVAAGLIARDVEPGDRIALMLPTGIDFFSGFFGASMPAPFRYRSTRRRGCRRSKSTCSGRPGSCATPARVSC